MRLNYGVITKGLHRRISVQSHEPTMKSPAGSEALRSSRRLKELLVLKAVFEPAELVSVPAGVQNKENHDVARPPRPVTPQDLLSSNVLEDSGYLSLHSSQVSYEHHEETDRGTKQPLDLPSPRATVGTTTSTSANSEVLLSSSPPLASLCSTSASTPRAPLSSSTPRAASSCRNSSLPIVRFQQAVCAELARSFQKCQRYDWGLVSQLAEKHLLDRVIGGQMGRDHVDVFSALQSRNLRGILYRILGLLGDLDLISCRAVSTTWQKIIQEDCTAMGCIQRARKQMENNPLSQVVPGAGLTRDSGQPRVALSSLQTLASTSSSKSTPVPLEPTSSSSQTRFNIFLQAASSLKQDEGLRCCRRCGLPARHNAQAQRATCMRSSCQFDFCTRCQEAFHGAQPCRVIQPCRSAATSRPRGKHGLRRL